MSFRGVRTDRRTLILLLAGLCVLVLTSMKWLLRESLCQDPSSQVVSLGTTNEQSISSLASTTLANQSVTFMYIVGLEGTGHHLVAEILSEAPAVFPDEEKETDLLSQLKELQVALVSNSGLFHLHCGLGHANATVSAVYKDVVMRLRRISDTIGNATSLAIPLNSDSLFKYASYPQYRNCNRMRFPHLDILYDACDAAGVACGHVYIHRDPYSVLQSTTNNRKFNKDILQAIETNIVMLKIIYTQLSMHPTRTHGCFDFFRPIENNTQAWDTFHDLFFQWSNRNVFDNYIASVYRPPTPLTNQEREDMVAVANNVYMRTLLRLHHIVIRLCESQWRANARGRG